MNHIVTLIATIIGVAGEKLNVDFQSDKVDRSLFSPDVKDSKGQWRVTSANGLVAAIPKGTAERPPIKYVSRFDLEGDFEIIAEYRIVNLPTPHVPPGKDLGAASNNVELVVSGPGGWATVNRRNTGTGEVWGYFAQIGNRESRSKGSPGKGKAGCLAVRRQGDRLIFLRGEEASRLEELGTIDFFREPISEVSLQINAWNSTDAVDVGFPRVQISADRIIRRDGEADSSVFAWLRVVGLVVTAVGLAIGVRLLIRRRGSSRVV